MMSEFWEIPAPNNRRRFQLLYHPIDALNSGSELSSFAFNRNITLLTKRPAKIGQYSVNGQGILRARVAC